MKYTIGEISETIRASGFHGDDAVHITEMLQITDKSLHKSALCWCADRNIHLLKELPKSTVIISNEAWNSSVKEWTLQCNVFVVDNARRGFAKMMKTISATMKEAPEIHPSAVIHPSAILKGNNISIGANVVIEKDVSIQDNVEIGHNTCILSATQIASNVIIGSNNTIGGVGFGYELNEDGAYDVIPHIGNVIIKKDVEIGNNVCIDRAVLGATIIGENVKIDNLVHIAHGVVIGENSMIIANSMIAGSCEIGKNVWVSPSVSILQKTQVEDNALLGMGSVVIRNVDANTIVAGVPANKTRDR